MDDDESKSLDSTEFAKALKDYRISSDPAEHEAIFRLFDTDGNGQISYDEFLRHIIGGMNARREAIVAQAFKKLDKDGSGEIDVRDIKGVFNASKHPDVLSSKKTEDDVIGEFLDTFEAHYANCHPNENSRDRTINMKEFKEYYNNISCSIDNDEYFELMIRNAWNLDNKKYGKAWAGEY